MVILKYNVKEAAIKSGRSKAKMTMRFFNRKKGEIVNMISVLESEFSVSDVKYQLEFLKGIEKNLINLNEKIQSENVGVQEILRYYKEMSANIKALRNHIEWFNSTQK